MEHPFAAASPSAAERTMCSTCTAPSSNHSPATRAKVKGHKAKGHKERARPVDRHRFREEPQDVPVAGDLEAEIGISRRGEQR